MPFLSKSLVLLFCGKNNKTWSIKKVHKNGYQKVAQKWVSKSCTKPIKRKQGPQQESFFRLFDDDFHIVMAHHQYLIQKWLGIHGLTLPNVLN